MDCPSEENLVRMRLADVGAVRKVEIDLSDRTVAVYHEGSVADIEAILHSLKLRSSLVKTIVSTAAIFKLFWPWAGLSKSCDASLVLQSCPTIEP